MNFLQPIGHVVIASLGTIGRLTFAQGNSGITVDRGADSRILERMGWFAHQNRNKFATTGLAREWGRADAKDIPDSEKSRHPVGSGAVANYRVCRFAFDRAVFAEPQDGTGGTPLGRH